MAGRLAMTCDGLSGFDVPKGKNGQLEVLNMLTYLEAFAIAMAALVNAVLAYEERANRWKSAVLWTIAGFLAVLSIHTVWPFYGP
jgi:hypothetical protein